MAIIMQFIIISVQNAIVKGFGKFFQNYFFSTFCVFFITKPYLLCFLARKCNSVLYGVTKMKKIRETVCISQIFFLLCF